MVFMAVRAEAASSSRAVHSQCCCSALARASGDRDTVRPREGLRDGCSRMLVDPEIDRQEQCLYVCVRVLSGRRERSSQEHKTHVVHRSADDSGAPLVPCSLRDRRRATCDHMGAAIELFGGEIFALFSVLRVSRDICGKSIQHTSRRDVAGCATRHPRTP